ncbi:phosphate acyltransferase PlsX [Haloplasma contractile]|uniref:Phosphate acyltransferase n=1 Tax=Haloplasma contractile SSD-17B TaxID=1033810 RepID=U2EFK3_9MOLU|nr:phosphate acyltransferase PlsX [Haloplasma contractile]ERJ13436.1 Phosphate acyltransferase protein [Haloplasma contractile SSD-17B]
MIRIAVDAMGGDFAPKIAVEGAVSAIKQFSDIEITLYGDEAQIKSLLTDETRINIVHCTDYFRMDEKDLALAIRRRKETSMYMAMVDAREGVVDAFVTAGPTGAVVSGGVLVVKRIKGFSKPALGPIIPQINGDHALLIDCGANPEVKPEHLQQFAEIAAVYCENVMGKKNPRVALLNNGEEEGKGRQLEQDTYKLLKESNLNFIGNMEGKQGITGHTDIIVTDGFTGNIFLKTTEGVAKGIGTTLKEEIKSNLLGKIGGLFLLKNLKRFKKRFDASEVGGSVLFGVRAPVIKAHGSSDSYALMNAIKQARSTVEGRVIDIIKEQINEKSE